MPESQTVEQWNAIWEATRVNRAALDACAIHAFSVPVPADLITGKTWACQVCGGQVTNIEKFWYELGRAHQRREEQAWPKP